MRASALLMLLLALLLSGCGPSEQQRKLDDTFRFVRNRLESIGHAPMAAMSYQSTIEEGGTPLDYVIASMPDNGDYDAIVWQGPAAPWTVVIRRGTGANSFVLDAYGESASKPSQSESFTVTPMSPRTR